MRTSCPSLFTFIVRVGFLDLILISISENCTESIEYNLEQAINQINITKSVIESLNNEGFLTDEAVIKFYEQFDYFINEITILYLII